MSYYSIESRLMGMKIESPKGTEATLTSDDFDIRFHELALGDISIEMDGMSKIANGNHTHGLEIPGVSSGSATGTIKLARGVFNFTSGTYTDYKLPYEKVMYASGLKCDVGEPTDETTEDGSFVFTPHVSNDLQPVTINIIDEDAETGNGNLYSLTGAMSSTTIEMETGKPILIKQSYSGGVGSVKTVIAGSMPEYLDASALSTIPKAMLDVVVEATELDDDGAVKSGGTVKEFCLSTATLDPGNSISMVKCQASASGIKYFVIKERKPTFKMTSLLESLEDFDYWASIKAGGSWKIKVTGADFELEIPRAQAFSSAIGDGDSGVTNELTFNAMTNLQGATSDEREEDYRLTIKAINVGI